MSHPQTPKLRLLRLSPHPSIRATDLIPRFNLALASVELPVSVLHPKGNAKNAIIPCLNLFFNILCDSSHAGPAGHVQIMNNPNRARGSHHANGRGGHPGHPTIPANVITARGRGGGAVSGSQTRMNGSGRSSQTPTSPTSSSRVNGYSNASSHISSDPAAETTTPSRGRGRGFMPRGRGFIPSPYRGGSSGRGRGRGSFTPIPS